MCVFGIREVCRWVRNVALRWLVAVELMQSRRRRQSCCCRKRRMTSCIALQLLPGCAFMCQSINPAMP